MNTFKAIATAVAKEVIREVALKELKSGKYDDVLGRLLNQLLQYLLQRGVHVSNDISAKLEDCAICMDKKANTKTSCNHYLCLSCWMNIVNLAASPGAVSCPFCRQPITTVTVVS